MGVHRSRRRAGLISSCFGEDVKIHLINRAILKFMRSPWQIRSPFVGINTTGGNRGENNEMRGWRRIAGVGDAGR